MRASRVNTDIAQKIRQVVVLFILILAGIIATVSAEAKDHTINGDHRSTTVKKQTRMYANACSIMEAKRNKKAKARVFKHKYR